MERTINGSTSHHLAWIPEKYAVLQKYLEIKMNDTWENGWKVTMVGTTRREESEAVARSNDYRKQREASDI